MNLDQAYKDDLFTHKSFIHPKIKINIGIDEAGRGPVLGHLVYGALITPDIVSYPDSKKVTHSQRKAFFNQILKDHSFIFTSIHPRYISRKMLAPISERQNLNKISFSAVINMIKEIEKVYEIGTVYVDTLGPEESYKKMLLSHFPNYKFVVEKKADHKYKIVGGASIVAKVIRDSLIENWVLSDKDIGSGYPGDEVTKKWLERNLKVGKEMPEIVRKSWATVRKYLSVVKTKNVFRKMGFKKVGK